MALPKSPKYAKFSGDQTFETNKDGNFKILLAIVTILSLVTRFWNIQSPAEVVFDEVHFGKFASQLIRREYFFDVHPPLGRLLLAFIGWLVGYDGHYNFTSIGEDYIENNVPYISMRSYNALLGACVPILVLKSLRELGASLPACAVGAALALFDNALVCQSRLILLDSPLVLFCIFAHYAWIKFYNYRREPFSIRWWIWLSLTGFGLGLAMGIKMVGLLTVAVIGLAVLMDLWRLMDLKLGLTLTNVAKHFMARALLLIALPVAMYLIYFVIHFAVLTNSGTGDWMMTPTFQSTLKGNRMAGDSIPVFYGANVTIKHYDTHAFLHSHAQFYPLRHSDGKVSSQGQQVTGYPHRDENNTFQILPENQKLWASIASPESEHIPVLEKDRVVFRHVSTGALLLTHDVASPLTRTNQEVACFKLGTSKKPDSFYTFILQPEKKSTGDNPQIVSLGVRFKIYHDETGVSLKTYKSALPSWGFGQMEVNGERKASKSLLWFFEDVRNVVRKKPMPKAKGRDDGIAKPGFFAKFSELLARMIASNSELTKVHPYMTPAYEWPFVTRGVSYWQDKAQKQIYLIGNPIGWWFVLAAMIFLGTFLFIQMMASRRRVYLVNRSLLRWVHSAGGFVALAWAMHYIPFMFMGRSLFLHHYLPALVFSFILAGLAYDFCVKTVVEANNQTADDDNQREQDDTAQSTATAKNDEHLKKRPKSPKLPFRPVSTSLAKPSKRAKNPKSVWYITISLIVIFMVTFIFFAPMSYGDTSLTREQIASRKWLNTWEYQYSTAKKKSSDQKDKPIPPPQAQEAMDHGLPEVNAKDAQAATDNAPPEIS